MTTGSNNESSAAELQTVSSDPGTEDEIEKIINEIEQLQQDMNTATEPKAQVETQVKAQAETPVESPVPSHSDLPTESDLPTGEDEQSLLKEFSDQGDEPWLAETLAQLKAEEDEAGKRILDDDSFEESLLTDLDTRSKEAEEDSGGFLAMELKGNMTFKLKHEHHPKEVMIYFSREEVRIRLSDGIEFKMAAQEKVSKKAA